MKFMKQALGDFHKLNMIDPEFKILFIILLLKWDFIAFKTNIISMRKGIVNTDDVNDVICTRQYVFKCVVIRVFYDTTLSTE